MNPIIKRMKQPTPTFFRKLRKVALTIGAIGTAIVTAPFPLPSAIVTIGGYLAVAGVVAGGVSQTAVKNERK